LNSTLLNFAKLPIFTKSSNFLRSVELRSQTEQKVGVVMTYKRVLVALDRSSQAPIVFEQALEQVQMLQKAAKSAHLMITHTIRMDTEVSSGAFMGLGTLADVDTYNTLRKVQQERIQHHVREAEEWLQGYYRRAIEQGIRTEIDCHVGEPALRICDLAQNWNADLVVLGRRGHQGIKEIVLGSVSNYVVHHAPCSVLIVQGTMAEPENSEHHQESQTPSR
jgi:nucleotide-binding universal stress UspA family protein